MTNILINQNMTIMDIINSVNINILINQNNILINQGGRCKHCKTKARPIAAFSLQPHFSRGMYGEVVADE